MAQHNTEPRKYLVAMIIGVIIGGLMVAVATKALPRIMAQLMKQMMSEMPQRMMAQMKAEGIDPMDMCQRMIANFNQQQSTRTPTEESRA